MPVFSSAVTTGASDRRGDATPRGDFRIQGLNRDSVLHPANGLGRTRNPVWALQSARNVTLSCQLFRGDEHGTPISPATVCSPASVTSKTTTYNLRNMALLLDGRYHIVQMRGPDAERDEVTRLYEQAAATYRYTG